MNVKEAKMKLNWVLIVTMLLYDFAMGQAEEFQVVPAEKIPDILNTVSIQVKDNFLRIHSWEGEISVSRYVVYKENTKDIFERHTDAFGEPPVRIAKFTTSTITFSSDLDKGLFYAQVSRKTPSRYMDPMNGRDLGTKSIPWYRISILTPEYHFHSSPSKMLNGYPVQRKAIKDKLDKDCTACERPSVFNPADLFDTRTPVWKKFPRIVEKIKERGEYVADAYALKVEQKILPNTVQYRVHEPFKTKLEGGNLWEIKTFSSDIAYNMISLEVTSTKAELLRRQTLEYQPVQNVYLPSKAIYEIFDPNDGILRYRKELTFKDNILNRVIPAEKFTYKNLGLENNDEFVDKTLEKRYTYQDGILVEAQKTDK